MTEKLEEAEERARELYDCNQRLEAHVHDLESRKRAPLYQKKQVSKLSRNKPFCCGADAAMQGHVSAFSSGETTALPAAVMGRNLLLLVMLVLHLLILLGLLLPAGGGAEGCCGQSSGGRDSRS
jgi:hypothetical protein